AITASIARTAIISRIKNSCNKGTATSTLGRTIPTQVPRPPFYLKLESRSSKLLLFTEAPMPWIYLVLAGACEMVWPLGFKYTNGFSTRYPLVGLTFLIMILSFALMAQATRGGIHVGTACAVWTGSGAA